MLFYLKKRGRFHDTTYNRVITKALPCRCKSCVSVCEDAAQFAVCREECAEYLQGVLTVHNTSERQDIHTLTVMVALTAAMTSAVLIAVFLLITMKVTKRKRVKTMKQKIAPSSVFTVDQEKVELGLRSSRPDLGLTNPGLVTGPGDKVLVAGGLRAAGTSMQTMTTQLSDETVGGLEVGRGRREEVGRRRRAPSEDCVVEEERVEGAPGGRGGQVV